MEGGSASGFKAGEKIRVRGDCRVGGGLRLRLRRKKRQDEGGEGEAQTAESEGGERARPSALPACSRCPRFCASACPIIAALMVGVNSPPSSAAISRSATVHSGSAPAHGRHTAAPANTNGGTDWFVIFGRR